MKQDVPKAIQLFEQAAQLGHGIGMNALGTASDCTNASYSTVISVSSAVAHPVSCFLVRVSGVIYVRTLCARIVV